MNISAAINRDDGTATVVVSGEVDLSSAPIVENAIYDAVAADGVDAVVVDLSAVRFLDSSGIALLLKGRRQADENGVSYQVTGAHGTVRRVLELSGVWEHLSSGPHQPADK